jgi:chromatin segregation and condensation protein Rec8/ScpA/Scc1 (kleisin family)
MKAPLISTSLIGAAMLLAAANAFADAPGAHPAYLHARSDLRRAELLMQRRDEPNVMRDLGEAAREAHEAIREVDAAAAWDRKDLIDNPHIDTYPDRPGRFRAIAQFLWGARRDIEREEDNPAAREWRNRALHHIDESIRLVRRAARDDWRDEWLR